MGFARFQNEFDLSNNASKKKNEALLIILSALATLGCQQTHLRKYNKMKSVLPILFPALLGLSGSVAGAVPTKLMKLEKVGFNRDVIHDTVHWPLQRYIVVRAIVQDPYKSHIFSLYSLLFLMTFLEWTS